MPPRHTDLESHLFYPGNMAVHGLVVCMSQSIVSARLLAEDTHQTRPWPQCMFVYYQALPQVCNHDYHTKLTHAMCKDKEHNGIICTQSESGGLVMTVTGSDESDEGSSHFSEVKCMGHMSSYLRRIVHI